MKKNSVIGFCLITLFCINSFAQNQTITAKSTGYVRAKDDLENLNRPQSVEAEKKVSTVNLELKVLEIINKRRGESGLSALKWSDDAAKIARYHSKNMAEFKFFSHLGRDGLSVDERADSLGVSKWRAIGENIAFNRGYENPVEFACERWMKSTAHRENLLNPRWKESGIGVSIADDGAYYFTQIFLVR